MFSLILILLGTSLFSTQVTGKKKHQKPHYRLGQYDVFRDQITLSGFSSGGTFAQHMFVSHSSMILGIATFNHAYYRCGPGNGKEIDYDNACTVVGSQNLTYDVNNAIADIEKYEEEGLIDSTENLRDKLLYVYAGTRSTMFSREQNFGAISVFEPFIKNPRNILTRVQDAEQLMPSDRFGSACTENAEENFFIGNCGISGAAESLQFLLGRAIQYPMMNTPLRTVLLTFDQTEFFYGYEGKEDMDTEGFIYIPMQCYKTRCYLHFYFHGCYSGREFSGADHVINSGFLEVAEANNLIVVFPQALSSEPENAIGCWDTYGLTGEYYGMFEQQQAKALK